MRLERRCLIKSVLASSAVAGPLLGTSLISPAAAAIRKSAPYVPSDDAALVDLGRQFEEAHAAWIPCWQEWDRIEREWRETLKAKGLSFHEHGEEAILSIFTEMGGDDASDANDKALVLVEDLADLIRELKATTIAGIAAKAKVAAFDAVRMQDLLKPDGKRDHAPQAILTLIGEIEALARASA